MMLAPATPLAASAAEECGEVDAITPPELLGWKQPWLVGIPQPPSDLTPLGRRRVVGNAEELSSWLTGHRTRSYRGRTVCLAGKVPKDAKWSRASS